MPPETDRLRYTRGALAALRRALEERSREELVDLVCHLQKTYVFDQTLPYDVPLPERASEPEERPDVPPGPDGDAAAEADPQDTPVRRFARLVDGLKRKTGLPQLEGFATDAEGRAFLVVDNQKVTFGERVTIEFFRGRSAGAAPGAAPPAPAAPPAAPPPPARGEPRGQAPFEPSRPAPPPRTPPKAPPKAAPPRPQPTAAAEDDDETSGRMSRLELD